MTDETGFEERLRRGLHSSGGAWTPTARPLDAAETVTTRMRRRPPWATPGARVGLAALAAAAVAALVVVVLPSGSGTLRTGGPAASSASGPATHQRGAPPTAGLVPGGSGAQGGAGAPGTTTPITGAASGATVLSAPPATTVAPAPAPTSTAPTTTSPPTTSGAAVVTVTAADAGRTITLRVGQRLQVALTGSPSDAWSAPASSDGTVLPAQQSSADPSTGDSSGTFLAAAAGQARVTATQTPACAQRPPYCGMPSRLWEVTVDVVG